MGDGPGVGAGIQSSQAEVSAYSSTLNCSSLTRCRDRELARQWRRRNQSDQDRLIEEEHAEDIAELNEMYLGQQVQITHAGRSQLRQLGFRVRSDGMVWVRRLDEDE